MFEPGDIVECVRGPMARVVKGRDGRLPIGSVWTVEEYRPVGSSPDGQHIIRHPTLAIHGHDCSFLREEVGWFWGPYADRFRLLKRRDPDLMRKLLTEPLPAELVAA